MSSQAIKKEENQNINGIDVRLLEDAIANVTKDPKQGLTRWKAATSWQGGTVTQTKVDSYEIAGQSVAKDFTISTDEPLELGGTNHYANPQETLLAALNACMTVGFVALCAMEGITLEEVRIETEGELDLRGFFALDPNIKPGYDELSYRIHVKGDGTPEQFRQIHEKVCQTSPNRFNLTHPVPLRSELVID